MLFAYLSASQDEAALWSLHNIYITNQFKGGKNCHEANPLMCPSPPKNPLL